MVQSKICRSCDVEQPTTQFHVDNAKKDGLRGICKICAIEKSSRFANTERGKKLRDIWRHEYLSTNVGKIKNRLAGRKFRASARGIEYRNSSFRKLSIKRAHSKYQSKNRQKSSAHRKVHRAIKNGVLPPPISMNCSNCQESAVHYHHHLGYEAQHALSVVPLCFFCHKAAHPKG